MYSAEALSWNNKTLARLENAFSHAYMKIFKTFDRKNIEICQFSMGYFPLRLLLDCRKLNFLAKLEVKNPRLIKQLGNNMPSELESIITKHNLKSTGKDSPNWKSMLWLKFEGDINR